MAGYLYAFQAKSIQAYVLEGGKLVDLAGASAIVDDIARPEGGDGLGCILDLLGQKPDILRRAGGAFTVWSDSKAQLDAIRAAMTLHIQIAAPGLDFVDAWVSAPSVGEALDEIEARLVAARTLPVVSLPALPPQTLRAPRTGGGAVSRDAGRENVPVDDATRQKRGAAKRSQHDRLSLFERRLLLKIPGGFRWPVDFDETSAEAKPAPRDGCDSKPCGIWLGFNERLDLGDGGDENE